MRTLRAAEIDVEGARAAVFQVGFGYLQDTRSQRHLAQPERHLMAQDADALRDRAAMVGFLFALAGDDQNQTQAGPIPQRIGVLRHQVPLWLRQMPLAPSVLQITEAHLKHGGAGAFYIYLRRP